MDQGIVIGNAILASALLLTDRIERLERTVRESGLDGAMVEAPDRWWRRSPRAFS
jgi:hypothetical protein